MLISKVFDKDGEVVNILEIKYGIATIKYISTGLIKRVQFLSLKTNDSKFLMSKLKN